MNSYEQLKIIAEFIHTHNFRSREVQQAILMKNFLQLFCY